MSGMASLFSKVNSTGETYKLFFTMDSWHRNLDESILMTESRALRETVTLLVGLAPSRVSKAGTSNLNFTERVLQILLIFLIF